jgi:ornithine carbamoyltransferase
MRDFLSIKDCSIDKLEELLELSSELKELDKANKLKRTLEGKILAMLFEKASLRTRISFEVAMADLGGVALYLKPEDIGVIGKREPAKDMARVLTRYVHGIMARTFAHETLLELARYADVPVINALSDWSHPCQAMADILTIREHCGDLKGLRLAYIGDGNNVARSLAFACAKFGMKLVVASPEGYELDTETIDNSNLICADSVHQLNEPKEAVKDTNVVYTDTWVSMGQEDEKQKRIKVFQSFQLNSELMTLAPADAKVMHCLPAYRGLEITDEVAESENSIIFDQAENRLHFQRALLQKLLLKNPKI